MRVVRLGHAGLVVMGGRTRCLIDPVFFDPFEAGINRFEPPVEIDGDAVATACDFVVLSHEHMDHFCVRSLRRIPRDRPVFHPRGATLIEHALDALGFIDRRPVVPGQRIDCGDLALVFTPSEVSFPEVGILIGADGRWLWNCVDTEIGEQALALVASVVERLDLMLANFQTLAEEELACDGLGSGFPHERYARRLHTVIALRPRFVVPAACGYSYAHAPWLDTRGFPIGEDEFLRDAAVVAPETVGVKLSHGMTIEVATGAVAAEACGWTRPRPATIASDWRPDRGIPPLSDDDPYGHGSDALIRDVHALLDGPFLEGIASGRLSEWRRRLAAADVVWRLEVVAPDSRCMMRWLDFSAPMRWSDAEPGPPKLITAIAASTLVGLARGEATPYRALFTRRVVVKLYAATPWGVQMIGSLADEPVGKVLFPGANRRFVDAELQRSFDEGDPGLPRFRSLRRGAVHA
jgi:hypothetical protein